MTLHVLKEVFPEPLSLDLGTQFLYLPSMVVEKANPADPVGDYKADGWWVGGAITFSLLF